jgi:hypothetical protein
LIDNDDERDEYSKKIKQKSFDMILSSP